MIDSTTKGLSARAWAQFISTRPVLMRFREYINVLTLKRTCVNAMWDPTTAQNSVGQLY